VLGLQNQVASAVAKQIRLTISPGEQIRSGIERPINPQAGGQRLWPKRLLASEWFGLFLKTPTMIHLT